jgi:hypothetical protein
MVQGNYLSGRSNHERHQLSVQASNGRHFPHHSRAGRITSQF